MCLVSNNYLFFLFLINVLECMNLMKIGINVGLEVMLLRVNYYYWLEFYFKYVMFF